MLICVQVVDSGVDREGSCLGLMTFVDAGRHLLDL